MALPSRDATCAGGDASSAALGTEPSTPRTFGNKLLWIAIANIAAINASDAAVSSWRRLQR